MSDESYLARLRALLGGRPGKDRAARSRRSREGGRVLFVSGDGARLGPLTSQLAMARRASRKIEPVFLTTPPAAPLVGHFGFPWEGLPSQADHDGASWSELFLGRLVEAVHASDPKVLVMDGTWPDDALREVRGKFSDLAFAWIRHAMWRADADPRRLGQSELFDLIVEPGELAAEFDRGPTAGRKDTHTVGPVTLFDADELLAPEQARAELGMDPQARALLVMPEGGNVETVTSDVDVVADEVAAWDGWQVYLAGAPAAGHGTVTRTDIHVLSTYPLARHLRAFDAAVAASDYTSYHELLIAGVPTIFVPGLDGGDDDRAGRAFYAEKAGIGMCLQNITPDVVGEALRVLTTERLSAAMRQRMQDVYPPNGATEAMRLVEEAAL